MGANSSAFQGWHLCHVVMVILALGSLAFILATLMQQARQLQSEQLIAAMRH